jgi:hypothetical protein
MAASVAMQAFTKTVRFTITLAEVGVRVAASPLATSGNNPTKFRWDHLRRKVGEGRVRSLKRAAADVRRATQREMSVRKPLSTPRLIDLGTVNGERLVAKRTQIARNDRVTSWKTAMFPKGFLRSDIEYDYDPSTDTVVIGPRKFPKLNRLHEIGGTVPLYFLRTTPPSRVPRRFSGGTRFGITTNRPAKGKIPEAFRDQIKGP